MKARTAKFQIGQIVRHRVFSFRGVIFDIDPEFNNTEEWWLSIPEAVRPHKDQPFYHLPPKNAEAESAASPRSRAGCPTIRASRSGIRRSPRFLSETNPADIDRAIR